MLALFALVVVVRAVSAHRMMLSLFASLCVVVAVTLRVALCLIAVLAAVVAASLPPAAQRLIIAPSLAGALSPYEILSLAAPRRFSDDCGSGTPPPTVSSSTSETRHVYLHCLHPNVHGSPFFYSGSG